MADLACPCRSGLALERPKEQAFTAMPDGWAQRLSAGTVAARHRPVGAFAAHVQALPWSGTAQLADEWFTDLRAVAARGKQETPVTHAPPRAVTIRTLQLRPPLRRPRSFSDECLRAGRHGMVKKYPSAWVCAARSSPASSGRTAAVTSSGGITCLTAVTNC